MTGPSAAVPDAAEFDSLLYGAMSWENLDPTVGRLNALLASGQITIIRSDRLQAALSSWPAVLEDMQENERLTREMVYDHFLPYLWRRIPLLGVDVRAGVIESTLESAFRTDRQSLLRDLEFANLVEDRWANTAYTIQDGEPVRVLIDEIISLIETEIVGDF